MEKYQLFCFPYAGGSATFYNQWKKYSPNSMILKPIELSGRGTRFGEPFYNDVNEIVDDVLKRIEPDLGNRYAFFGHSMGGMIAYELTRAIEKKSLPLPAHIFVSGRKAPHVLRNDEKKYHLMEGKEFQEEILELGGINEDFFSYPDLKDIFLPILKNDLRLSENYSVSTAFDPLDIGITAFFGKDEDLKPEQCDGWKLHTKRKCSVIYFNGGHFFLQNEFTEIIKYIDLELNNKVI